MDTGYVLTTIGALLLAGLAIDWVGRRLPLPRVTLLLVFGVVIGPEVGNWLPQAAADQWFAPVTKLALVMVGFLLGERFSVSALRQHGRVVLVVSITNVLGATLVTLGGLLLVGTPPTWAVLLGAIAGASAPAATYDVVAEDRADGPFTRTLLGIVGIDDAWSLLVFGVALAAAELLAGQSAPWAALVDALRETGGGIALGAVLGVLAAPLTHRIQPGQPTLLEALGIVLLTAGLAALLEVSAILAAMTLGVVLVNRGDHHERAFYEIEHLEWPLMVLFFVLAGASLHLSALAQVGLIGAVYMVCRLIGLIGGARLGGQLAGAEPAVRKWMGLALLPQAGVALGMALLVQQRFPAIGEALLPLVIGATVVFEITGPMATRAALRRAGEA